MKILSIIDIIDGELLNSPSISFVYSIKTDVNKVKESDLFFAKNLDDAETAISNGAFAIVFEKDFDITNNEIALIKVKSLELAMIKLIRFKLSSLNLNAYSCESISYDILKIYNNSFEKKVYLLSNNIEKNFKFLDDIKDTDFIFSKSKTLIDKIYPKNSIFEDIIDTKEIKNLVEHSLFETSFSFKSYYFSRIKISSLYINNLINIFIFSNYNLDLSKLKSFQALKTIFLDKNFEPVDFGKSNRFIICQENKDLVQKEINYIKDKYKYAKSIFISKDGISFLKENEQIIINSLEELTLIVKNTIFNSIYLVGFNHKETLEYFQKPQKTVALF